jgi:outer membrane protein
MIKVYLRKMKFVPATLLAVSLCVVPAIRAEDAPRALTLKEAVQTALEKSPDLATAQFRIKAARAAYDQTSAAFWPQLRLSASYAGSDNPVQAFMMTLNQRALNMATADFNHPGATDNLNGKIIARYNLYNGGQDEANRQASKLGTEALEKNRDAIRNDLVFEVTRAWYTVDKARQFITTANTAVTSMEANLNTASNRFSQGSALKTDVLDAQVRLAAARENAVLATNALALSEVFFRNVIGVGENENVTAAPQTFTNASTLRDPYASANKRPELAAAEKTVAVAEQQLRAARGGYRPRVNAFASYDVDSGNATTWERSWLAGVNVEMDVFDGFLSRGKVAEARANLEAAREQFRKLQLAIQLEVKQAQLNLADARARLETTGASIAQAEESLQLTKHRYAAGLALFTQVLDAETAVTMARQRRIAAAVDSQIAAAALEKALGTLTKE